MTDAKQTTSGQDEPIVKLNFEVFKSQRDWLREKKREARRNRQTTSISQIIRDMIERERGREEQNSASIGVN